LRAAYSQFQNDGFVVLSVSIQEDETAVADFISRHDLSYPFVMDTDGNISQNYSIYTTPTTYFVNPDGVIINILPGMMTQQWITANLEAVEG
jgi:peroxiredoxin